MKTVIYGVGLGFEEYLISVKNPLENVVALVDKSEKKQGMVIDGITVVSPEKINELEYDRILISSKLYFDEIRSELINQGCDKKKICKLMYDTDKYTGELSYWCCKYREEKGYFINSGYRDIFLGIANEKSDSFLDNKIIADFGCGPRGSLAWTDVPKVKIGVDVLANKYMYYFGECMINHGMIYLNSDEHKIPLPNNYVDVLSTINSLDHVAVLDNMVSEICRVLKPGGLLLGSFNLNEQATQCEPQTLTEQILNEKFLCKFNVLDKRIALKGKDNTYSELYKGNYVDRLEEDMPGEMWVKATLK